MRKTKVDIFQPYITQDKFVCFVVVDNIDDSTNFGYKSLVLDTRYERNFSTAQKLKKDFFRGNFPRKITGCALILIKKFISISSDGQVHFDLYQKIH